MAEGEQTLAGERWRVAGYHGRVMHRKGVMGVVLLVVRGYAQ